MNRKTTRAVCIAGSTCVAAGIAVFIGMIAVVQDVHKEVMLAYREQHHNSKARAAYHRLQDHEYNVSRLGSITGGSLFGLGVIALALTARSDRKRKAATKA